jgi:hypothetical protein
MEPIRFAAQIRYWNEEKASGLAVADIPAQHVAAFGGLKQQHVRGTIGGAEFASSVMPAGGGRLALSQQSDDDRCRRSRRRRGTVRRYSDRPRLRSRNAL